MNDKLNLNRHQDHAYEGLMDCERRILDALENISGTLGLHFDDIGPAVDHLIKYYSKVEGIAFVKPSTKESGA